MDVKEGLMLRHVQPADHARIMAVIDRWWDGRPVCSRLSQVFFSDCSSTGFVVERGDGVVDGLPVQRDYAGGGGPRLVFHRRVTPGVWPVALEPNAVTPAVSPARAP